MPAARADQEAAHVRLRSLLFVPGDRPERIEKALGSGADALILDLEDAVAPANKAAARQAVREALARADRPLRLFVRINPLGSPWLEADLEIIQGLGPDGIVLPKARSTRSRGSSLPRATCRSRAAGGPPRAASRTFFCNFSAKTQLASALRAKPSLAGSMLLPRMVIARPRRRSTRGRSGSGESRWCRRRYHTAWHRAGIARPATPSCIPPHRAPVLLPATS